ncbi:hypothetical protein FHU41_000272 [Psychromicrobium silvestre]|uniref:DUF3093 domain-containing protein n=1 Tax=Psychromicrobium silvestre TaxID=1645614 RepID=A0A7Y9LR41_9MICC|nr:DUF3093 domain-containing protein [Psychromicrobium silvestre]NYE94051.1 hypothetical protein [Psychromicrobium silvestre]
MPENVDESVPPNNPSSYPGSYIEKLWPSPWIWIVVLGISAAGILILAPINLFAGYVAAVVLFLLQGAFLITSTPRIEVDSNSLTVGRASIERRFIGSVEAFRGDAAFAQRGPKLNGLAFLCLRGWISPVVKIEITDESDPTPYWLTSTRRPEQLVAVLTASGASE